jgi:hypothetical protein
MWVNILFLCRMTAILRSVTLSTDQSNFVKTAQLVLFTSRSGII